MGRTLTVINTQVVIVIHIFVTVNRIAMTTQLTVTDSQVNIATYLSTNDQLIRRNVAIVTDLMKWLYLMVCIFGIINNFFVLFVIGKSRQLKQQPRNWLIFCQSVSDFLGAVSLTTVIFRSNSAQLEVILLFRSSYAIISCYLTIFQP